MLGLMRLGRQHGNPRLDAASARAIALGSCRFHTVKNILATGQDRRPLEPPAETAPTPTHATSVMPTSWLCRVDCRSP